MNFPLSRGTPLHQAQLQARALDAWRDAELVVRARWDAFLVADGASRRDAFAAYMAALDAEAAAAGDLVDASSSLAEAA
ncbi:MAG TPA: hypothetical protein VHR16_04205 [Candidatus Limnocylindrales bacterium]|jgi:hypothetical protein|nr:hypothetical protein [Candidatus Limnocylindrales bacterium]